MEDRTKKNGKSRLYYIKNIITGIFIYQIILFAISISLLCIINYHEVLSGDERTYVLINSALFGFLGCLIYFSRKSYVYLIEGKFSTLLAVKPGDQPPDIDSINCKIRGYYLYLPFRPFVGLIIGPILYMLAMSGLVTLLKKSIENPEKFWAEKAKQFQIIVMVFRGRG